MACCTAPMSARAVASTAQCPTNVAEDAALPEGVATRSQGSKRSRSAGDTSVDDLLSAIIEVVNLTRGTTKRTAAFDQAIGLLEADPKYHRCAQLLRDHDHADGPEEIARRDSEAAEAVSITVPLWKRNSVARQSIRDLSVRSSWAHPGMVLVAALFPPLPCIDDGPLNPPPSFFGTMPGSVSDFFGQALAPLYAGTQCCSLVVSGPSGAGKSTLVWEAIPHALKDDHAELRPRPTEGWSAHMARMHASDLLPCVRDCLPGPGAVPGSPDTILGGMLHRDRNAVVWRALEKKARSTMVGKPPTRRSFLYVAVDNAGEYPNLVLGLVSAAAGRVDQTTIMATPFLAQFTRVVLGIAGTGVNELACGEHSMFWSSRKDYTSFVLDERDGWVLDMHARVIERELADDMDQRMFRAMLADFPALRRLSANARALGCLAKLFKSEVVSNRALHPRCKQLEKESTRVPPCTSGEPNAPMRGWQGIVEAPLATELLHRAVRQYACQSSFDRCPSLALLATRALALAAAGDVDGIDCGGADAATLVRSYGVLQWDAQPQQDAAVPRTRHIDVTAADSITIILMSCAGLLPPLSGPCHRQLARRGHVNKTKTLVGCFGRGGAKMQRACWEEASVVWLWLRICGLRWHIKKGETVTAWDVVGPAFSQERVRVGNSIARFSLAMLETDHGGRCGDIADHLKRAAVWTGPSERLVPMCELQAQLQQAESEDRRAPILSDLARIYEESGAVVAINAPDAALADVVVLLPKLVLLVRLMDAQWDVGPAVRHESVAAPSSRKQVRWLCQQLQRVVKAEWCVEMTIFEK